MRRTRLRIIRFPAYAIDVLCTLVEAIEPGFTLYVLRDQEYTGYAQGQPGDVYARVEAVLKQAAQRRLEVIVKHKRWIDEARYPQ